MWWVSVIPTTNDADESGQSLQSPEKQMSLPGPRAVPRFFCSANSRAEAAWSAGDRTCPMARGPWPGGTAKQTRLIVERGHLAIAPNIIRKTGTHHLVIIGHEILVLGLLIVTLGLKNHNMWDGFG